MKGEREKEEEGREEGSQISLEEFIEGAEKDPWVMNQLKLDIGPCEWFMEQQKP
ncbi:hypothetical protein WMY93_012571 [Mugilogobius chulae]|uniref:Uncharacterized protein n=1 Tax=Mugilogobius chulae TaxID=88201 RepID=A0AAW0P6L4_9GOBI